MAQCPNCGGKLVKKVKVGDETIEPKGKVLVCENCLQAAEEGTAVESVEAPAESNLGAVGPRAEDLPREEGEPVPPPPETTEQAEGPPQAPAQEPQGEPAA